MKYCTQDLKMFLLENKAAIYISLLFSAAFVLPVILAGSIYIDDNTRIFNDFNWSGDGRFATNLLFELLSFGNGIVNIYPFGQLIASLILALSIILLCYSAGVKGSLFIVLSTIIAFNSQFLISNLSYRYDSLPMSISILLAVIPFIFMRRNWIFFLCSIFCLVLSFQMYQPSAMIYVICSLIVSAAKYEGAIGYIKSNSIAAAAFVASFALFKMIIIYVGGVGRADFFTAAKNPTETLGGNIAQHMHLFNMSAQSPMKIIYIILSALMLMSIVLVLKKDKAKATIILLTTPIVFVLTFIANALLKEAWFTSRILIAFPFFMVFIIVCSYHASVNKYFLYATLFLSCISSLVFSATYASALRSQDEVNNKYLNEISLVTNGFGVDKVAIYGDAPRSKEYMRAGFIYPIMSNIVPNYLKQGSGWAQMLLIRRSISAQFFKINEQDKIFKQSCAMGQMMRSSSFDYQIIGSMVVIDFTKRLCV
ncbi:TPA: glucosyltransferase domain-containing protein [Enterobacter kobei]|nr:glucosyltransferase domain-containing protein [Enterobacter kobei]